MKQTFKQWIVTYAGTTTYLSDIANDIAVDDTFPDTCDLSIIQAYLDKVGACEGAIAHMEWAYGIYQEETR